MTSSDKENLTRIRDNQRRSRARRRQYIQELEMQIKSYRARGIEVTTEIQRAARRVAEENKKMRILLNDLGFDDERISHFLQSGNSAIGPVDNIVDIGPACNQEGAAEVLEQLLIPHQPTGHHSEAYLTAPSTSRAAPDSIISSDIAGLSSETPTAEASEGVQLPGNTAFPAPNTTGFNLQGIYEPLSSDISTGEFSQYSPSLVGSSTELQFIQELPSTCLEDMSYSGLSFTPDRTHSVSTGSETLCDGQSQSYEHLGYNPICSYADDDIGADAVPFGVSLNLGTRTLVWA
ncbi:hypothetical protein GGR53DRAFT_224035 [Hypoxylon sp. FL1150]|nr:hypothetical protein GGR53DRAFT_224035 [Hypoxylon sp. FL1150]